jgi:hypothetical protein
MKQEPVYEARSSHGTWWCDCCNSTGMGKSAVIFCDNKATWREAHHPPDGWWMIDGDAFCSERCFIRHCFKLPA